MKFLVKIAFASGLATGAGALLYAAPDDTPAARDATAAELQAQTVALREQIVQHGRHVLYLQTVARKQKDVIKLNCINDKLVQMRPYMNLVDRAAVELESADDENRQAVFEQASGAATNVQRLRNEADQCIGEPALAADTSNTWTAPEVPDNPFTEPFDNDEYVEPPAYASPFN